MERIDFGSTFALKNLETNEFFKFLMERYTEEYKPIYSIGTEDRISYERKMTSRGGSILSDGVRVITNKAPLGELILGKKEGDEITFYPNKYVEVKYLVVAVGQERVAQYEKKLDSEIFAKKELEKTNEPSITNAEGNKKVSNMFIDEKKIATTRELKTEYKRGLDLFIEARKEKTLPIVQANYWTEDFCFVVGNLEIIDNVIYLVGTTLKKGKVYERNIKYPADKIFKKYDFNKEGLNSTYRSLFGVSYLIDPIELDPAFIRTLNDVDVLVKDRIGFENYFGYCYVYWETKKQILKDIYDIDWKSPAELNPTIMFE